MWNCWTYSMFFWKNTVGFSLATVSPKTYTITFPVFYCDVLLFNSPDCRIRGVIFLWLTNWPYTLFWYGCLFDYFSTDISSQKTFRFMLVLFTCVAILININYSRFETFSLMQLHCTNSLCYLSSWPKNGRPSVWLFDYERDSLLYTESWKPVQ